MLFKEAFSFQPQPTTGPFLWGWLSTTFNLGKGNERLESQDIDSAGDSD